MFSLFLDIFLKYVLAFFAVLYVVFFLFTIKNKRLKILQKFLWAFSMLFSFIIGVVFAPIIIIGASYKAAQDAGC